MPRSREEEAGQLYVEGAKAIRAGGHELFMLAGHLILMIKGTVNHKGPLWPVRILPDGLKTEVRLDRFIDYLRKPAREGLGVPSLHFLRQTLRASPKNGEEALDLVRKELAKEHVDLDAVADRERDAMPPPRELKAPHRPSGEGVPSTPLGKGNSTARRKAQLAARRPDLAEKVRAGTMKLSEALSEAGIRKKLTPLEQVLKLLPKLTEADRLVVIDHVTVLLDAPLPRRKPGA